MPAMREVWVLVRRRGYNKKPETHIMGVYSTKEKCYEAQDYFYDNNDNNYGLDEQFQEFNLNTIILDGRRKAPKEVYLIVGTQLSFDRRAGNRNWSRILYTCTEKKDADKTMEDIYWNVKKEDGKYFNCFHFLVDQNDQIKACPVDGGFGIFETLTNGTFHDSTNWLASILDED